MSMLSGATPYVSAFTWKIVMFSAYFGGICAKLKVLRARKVAIVRAVEQKKSVLVPVRASGTSSAACGPKHEKEDAARARAQLNRHVWLHRAG